MFVARRQKKRCQSNAITSTSCNPILVKIVQVVN